MTQQQCEAVAAGFITALIDSPATRNAWVTVANARDWPGLRTLIAQTLGLAGTPTQSDLDVMRAYADTDPTMGFQTTELTLLDPRVAPAILFNGLDHHSGAR